MWEYRMCRLGVLAKKLSRYLKLPVKNTEWPIKEIWQHRQRERVCATISSYLSHLVLRLDSLTMWWGQQSRRTRWRSRSWTSCSPPLRPCGSSTSSSGRWPNTAGWGRAPQPPRSPGIWATAGRGGRRREKEGGNDRMWLSRKQKAAPELMFCLKQWTSFLTSNAESFMINAFQHVSHNFTFWKMYLLFHLQGKTMQFCSYHVHLCSPFKLQVNSNSNALH